VVAIAPLTSVLHTGGSAVHSPGQPAPTDTGAGETPATIVTLSDRAQQLVAEAKAAEAVADIFALANGTVHQQAGPAKTRALLAHDAQTNAGLYILWSRAR
jgi:hypothetical protein